LKLERQPAPSDAPHQTHVGWRGNRVGKYPGGYIPGHDTRLAWAEARSEQAIRASELVIGGYSKGQKTAS